MISYAATKRNIKVTVRPIYLDEPTDFLKRQFTFGYVVSIANTGSAEVQQIGRAHV